MQDPTSEMSSIFAHLRAMPTWAETSAIVGVLLGILAMVSAYVAIPRLPRDFFSRTPPLGRARLLRRIVGTLLVIAGILMLVLPGPGAATALLGLFVLDLPAMRRLVIALLRRPKIAHAVNQLRQKKGRPPFVLPESKHA